MKKLWITAFGLCLLPMASMAQTNIKNAFSKLINDSKVEVIERHLEKKPDAKTKEADCEVYVFSMPKSSMQLVTDLEKAFEMDSDNAYQIENGRRTKENSPIYLAVGDGETVKKALVGSNEGMKYQLACFLDPEDESGTHRYAYAMEWEPTLKGDVITGRLVMTYATTQKFRQDSHQAEYQLSEARWKDGKLVVAGTADVSKLKMYSPPSWFDTLTSYITAMTPADTTTRRAFASKIYSHTKNLDKVDSRDREAARNLLSTMIGDERYKDSIIQQLIKESLVNLGGDKN